MEHPENDSHLAKKRKAASQSSPVMPQRIFQLSDYIYSEMLPKFDLKNTNVLLHCVESGNFGDIASTNFFADVIKKNRPQTNISILLELRTLEKDTIKNVLPTNLSVSYLTGYEFTRREELLTKGLEDNACVLGVSVGMTSPLLSNTHHRSFWEYGYSVDRTNVKGNTLAMGLALSEEGIMIPTVTPRQLSDVTTPWVVAGLAGTARIYHMHRRDYIMQMLALYNVAEIEKSLSTDKIAVVLPLVYTLEQYKNWGLLDVNFLKELGVGKISRITPQGTETMVIADCGKEINILSGPIPRPEMDAIQQHSQAFFGCGGDNTISECIALEKIPYYDGTQQKAAFFDDMIALAKELKLAKLTEAYEILRTLNNDAYSIREKNTPKLRWGMEPVYDLDKAESIPRKSAAEINQKIREYAPRLAALFSDPALEAEAKLYCQHIKANYNVESRLLASVDRELMLGNFPQLIEVEKKLWERFEKKEIKLEDVFTELRQAVTQCAENQPQPKMQI